MERERRGSGVESGGVRRVEREGEWRKGIGGESGGVRRE